MFPEILIDSNDLDFDFTLWVGFRRLPQGAVVGDRIIVVEFEARGIKFYADIVEIDEDNNFKVLIDKSDRSLLTEDAF